MKKHIIKIIFALLPGLICPWPVSAEVEWQLKQTINFDKKPIDMVVSEKGTYLFVLMEKGIIRVYDRDGSIKGEIKVEKNVDGIACGTKENILLLKSKKNRQIQKIDLNFIESINIEGFPYKGNADAPVVIAIFTDYQCPYCARLSSKLDQVIENNKDTVKIVFKNYPLPMHKYARKAAAAVLAAHEMGKFLEFHEALYENMRQLSDEKVREIATNLGLDPDELEKEMRSKKIQDKIYQDRIEAEKAGVTGTPSVFINGRRLKDRSLGGFQDVIDAELNKQH